MKSKLKMLFCTSERQTLKLSKGSKITLDKCLKNFESPEVL